MKLHFSNDWLRTKIASDPDIETEAGRPLEAPLLSTQIEQGRVAIMPSRNVVQLRIALGTLVHQLRQRDELTVEELAVRADVPEEELRQVETNPSYTARPRLIRQLSGYFGVQFNNLSQMAGATPAVDRKLYNEAVRFAAHSDVLTPLTGAQHELLNAFVASLNALEDQKGQ